MFSNSNSEEDRIRYVTCNDYDHKACARIYDQDDVGSVDCFVNCFKNILGVIMNVFNVQSVSVV